MSTPPAKDHIANHNGTTVLADVMQNPQVAGIVMQLTAVVKYNETGRSGMAQWVIFYNSSLAHLAQMTSFHRALIDWTI